MKVTDSTFMLYVGPMVMNNTTASLTTGGDHPGYHQQRPKSWVKGGFVAEPPKLYGPRAPVIVLKTSDCYTREPDNSGSLLGVLGEPPNHPHFYNSYRINME